MTREAFFDTLRRTPSSLRWYLNALGQIRGEYYAPGHSPICPVIAVAHAIWPQALSLPADPWWDAANAIGLEINFAHKVVSASDVPNTNFLATLRQELLEACGIMETATQAVSMDERVEV